MLRLLRRFVDYVRGYPPLTCEGCGTVNIIAHELACQGYGEIALPLYYGSDRELGYWRSWCYKCVPPDIMAEFEDKRAQYNASIDDALKALEDARDREDA